MRRFNKLFAVLLSLCFMVSVFAASGLVLAKEDAGNAGVLPSPWMSQDIGKTDLAGGTVHENGMFTVKSSGNDIYGEADSFHFAYQKLSGNGEIVAKVASIENTNDWAKIGVMIRENLEDSARQASVLVTPKNGTVMQYRGITGITGEAGKVENITAPRWLKLVRSGNKFTGYESADGEKWNPVGEKEVGMEQTFYVGLAVTSHDNSKLNKSVFESVNVKFDGKISADSGSGSSVKIVSYKKQGNDVIFTLAKGVMVLRVCKDDLMEVLFTGASSLPKRQSAAAVTTKWNDVKYTVAEEKDNIVITTSKIKAKVNKNKGNITYTDLKDNIILEEDSNYSKVIEPAAVEGVKTNSCVANFKSPKDEAIYGLGQHQNEVMNYKGNTEVLAQANTSIGIPVIVSSKGYGLLWDNNSITSFNGSKADSTKYSISSECGDLIDYYFMYGPELDNVIASYRNVTGKVPMYPKWAYGLFQSQDKYSSQKEILETKAGYRNNKIPVDCIVQDWEYWTPNYPWGAHKFGRNYPDPAAMVKELHKDNIHMMISVWPCFQRGVNTAKQPDRYNNYQELLKAGAIYPSKKPTGLAYEYYDALNPKGREIYWKQINNLLFKPYGIDSLWLDSTEPDGFPGDWDWHSADTAMGKGALNYNIYPLMTTKGVYEGQRKDYPNKRVFTLTRSAFAGQQRNAAASWSGDIQSTWESYKKQIPAGLNFSMSGIPYWTTDIGGYWGAPEYGMYDMKKDDIKELFTRWFQYGTFCPIYRIHGKGDRELYLWDKTTQANLVKMDNLRYRLMPYIYSNAWRVTSEGYTIMRHPVMDFRNDPNVFNIKDQYMFGPSILVNPVTEYQARSRQVYLPQGTWYDFWTGNSVKGGQTITADAPLDKIPLYIKAGSIIPMGPFIQYAVQSADPTELRIYRGADAAFTLYEDEGENYNYEKGKYSTISFKWNEKEQRLTIGDRKGSFSGMLEKRTFKVVIVEPGKGSGVDIEPKPNKTISYTGKAVEYSLK